MDVIVKRLSRLAFIRSPLFVAGFVIGGVLFGLIGYFIPIPSPFEIQKYRGDVLRESSANFKYIDPLLSCDIGTEDAFPELNPIRNAVASQINADIQRGDAQNISIYFRSLHNAKWFEINGNVPYAPASLLKTFVMMAYYKAADETDNPALLEQQVLFKGSADPSQDTPGEIIPHLTNGKPYTVKQLIEQMIIYSDNDALFTLVDHFDQSTLTYFELIFKDLNIPSPVTQSEKSLAFMTADQYAMVFRVLFGSTYLSERYSERALSLLAEAQYKDGIVAGVPGNIEVAHKFGVTTISTTTSTSALNQLHDCGIVYYPNNPYLLCVMTEGDNFGSLQNDIHTISATVYQKFDTYIKKTQSNQ